jgi:hypothetical protein
MANKYNFLHVRLEISGCEITYTYLKNEKIKDIQLIDPLVDSML